MATRPREPRRSKDSNISFTLDKVVGRWVDLLNEHQVNEHQVNEHQVNTRRSPELSAQAQILQNGPIALHIVVFDIIQQPAPPTDQHQKSPTGVVVLFMEFQMFGQILNPMSQ
jgi:hypothetical protein